MTIRPRPIRSLLFVPGNREERLRRALSSDADALVFDLEASVPRREAAAARQAVRRVLADHPDAAERVLVRVCDVRSRELDADLAAVVGGRIHGVMLPQVEGPGDVETLAINLSRCETRAGLERGRTIVLPLLETARGLRRAFEVAVASPRVAYLGAVVSHGGDVARCLGFRMTPGGEETLYLRSQVLLDTRAAGVHNPVVGIWSAIGDPDGLRRFAEQNRNLGYEGMMCVHPSQVPVVNEIFTPSAGEIDSWRRVIAAMEQAEAEGIGAIQVEGRLVDLAHLRTARERLARAEALGLAKP